MANLKMWLSSEATMDIVYKQHTKYWFSGLVYMVVNLLFFKYQPQDMTTHLEFRQIMDRVDIHK